MKSEKGKQIPGYKTLIPCEPKSEGGTARGMGAAKKGGKFVKNG